MVEQKLWNLVKTLYKKTMTGEISWEKTPSRNSFQAAFPKYTVQISEDERGDSSPDYIVALYDEGGRQLESASDVDILKALPPNSPEDKPFGIMRGLYREARSKALGVEAALDDLLSSLEGD